MVLIADTAVSPRAEIRHKKQARTEVRVCLVERPDYLSAQLLECQDNLIRARESRHIIAPDIPLSL